MLRNSVLLLLASMLGSIVLQASPIRLTYSVFFPATHIHSKLAREWAGEINRRTGGRVKIDVYPGGVLSGASENYECVVKGVSDLGMSCFSYSRGMFPMIECLDLPLGYRSGYQATLIANLFYRQFKPAELAETEIMYLHAHGPGVLASRRPVSAIEQLQGMSIRGTGISAIIIRALKGNAIGMGQPDTYEALRKGVVEGTLCPIETLKGWRQGEVINEVIKIPSAGYTTAMFVVMNRNTWEKLPDDIKQIIRQVNDEWIPYHGKKWDEADDAGSAFVTSMNKKIHIISDKEDAKAKALLTPTLKSWGEALDGKNHPGTQAMTFLLQAVQSSDQKLEQELKAVSSADKKASPLKNLFSHARDAMHIRLAAGHHAMLIGTILALLICAALFTRISTSAQDTFWSFYQRAVSTLCLKLLLLAEISLLLIIAITLADIIGRRLGHPVHGAIDLVQILACLGTSAALPYVTAVKGHIAVEYFFQRFSPQTRTFWDSISRTAMILFFTYACLACFQQGARLYTKHAVALSLGIPLFWIFYVMGLAFVLVILVVAYNITHPGRSMMNP